MKKSAAVPAVVALLAAVGVLVWLALRGPDELPPPPETDEPSTGRLDPLAMRALSHEGWPFRDFEQDISDLKKVDPETAEFAPDIKRNENERAIYFTKFSMHHADVHPTVVIEDLAQRFKDSGVRIFTGPPPVHETLRVTVTGDDIAITDVLDQIRMQTNEECRYIMTWQGLCIGSEYAIQQAQLDANAAAGEVRSREDAKSSVLDVVYRPAMEGWPAARIARDIREQTGVEVVVESDVWIRPTTLTWRAKPMPLREALSRICKDLGAYYRVRDGRVFLLQP